MTYTIKILLIIVTVAPIAFLQEQNQIEEKKAELQLLRNEISQLEENISLKSAKEKESFEILENYNKQAHLLNKLILKLIRQEAAQKKEIKILRTEIKSIESDIRILMNNYAKYVVALYKKGPYNELESIVNAESVRQALVRIQYLQKFSERRKIDLEQFYNKKQELIVARAKIESEQRRLEKLVAEKEADELQLKIKLSERKQILASIKKDKEVLRTNLSVKVESQKQIESLVAKLVAEVERKKREKELQKQNLIASTEAGIINEAELLNETNLGSEYLLNTANYSSFSELKGKMNWPVIDGKIVKGFGKDENKELKTVTLNYGVDISAKNDHNVRCVADGVISAIDWLPGYGSVIIVTHKGEYRTVYSHLSEIFVDEGEEIKAGKVIAKIGDSLEGKVLHFEIWNSRENQNPELWLASK
jgi:septal ring factor EnvC (AmiA/AmiB activator)